MNQNTGPDEVAFFSIPSTRFEWLWLPKRRRARACGRGRLRGSTCDGSTSIVPRGSGAETNDPTIRRSGSRPVRRWLVGWLAARRRVVEAEAWFPIPLRTQIRGPDVEILDQRVCSRSPNFLDSSPRSQQQQQTDSRGFSKSRAGAMPMPMPMPSRTPKSPRLAHVPVPRDRIAWPGVLPKQAGEPAIESSGAVAFPTGTTN